MSEYKTTEGAKAKYPALCGFIEKSMNEPLPESDCSDCYISDGDMKFFKQYATDTVEATKEKIAVMQAYIDGKVIEGARRFDDDWHEISSVMGAPLWNWDCCKFRVKQNKNSQSPEG